MCLTLAPPISSYLVFLPLAMPIQLILDLAWIVRIQK